MPSSATCIASTYAFTLSLHDALPILLCFNGIISFEVAIPLVLGQNFGRTINTEIAAVTGNVFAKRSARIHSLVNIFGLIWMVIALSRSEEHTSELQSRPHLVCRLLLHASPLPMLSLFPYTTLFRSCCVSMVSFLLKLPFH